MKKSFFEIVNKLKKSTKVMIVITLLLFIMCLIAGKFTFAVLFFIPIIVGIETSSQSSFVNSFVGRKIPSLLKAYFKLTCFSRIIFVYGIFSLISLFISTYRDGILDVYMCVAIPIGMIIIFGSAILLVELFNLFINKLTIEKNNKACSPYNFKDNKEYVQTIYLKTSENESKLFKERQQNITLQESKREIRIKERNIRKKEKEEIKRKKIEERERRRLDLEEKRAHEEKMEYYKGVFLTERQIDLLEEEAYLPVLKHPGIILLANEIAVYRSIAERIINRKNSYTEYKGEVILTNERLVFLNNERGFEFKLHNLTNTHFGITLADFQVKNQNYRLVVPCADLFEKAVDGIISKNIPFENTSSICLKPDQVIEVERPEFSLNNMSGHEFEYFCADILKKNNFSNVEVTPGSGDQGVDIIAEKDGIKYAIQCKKYQSQLSNTPVQEVNAGKIYYNCHVGVVMTNSYFTPGAVNLAKATGVLLWDGDKLNEMIKTSK